MGVENARECGFDVVTRSGWVLCIVKPRKGTIGGAECLGEDGR